MTEEKRGRGRPRPTATIERDEQVFLSLHNNGPTSRAQVAEWFGVNPNIIYLALNRLRNAGRIEKVRRGKHHLWAVAAAEPFRG
jgi:predicted transcriptional regulator of viral defense system